MTTSHPTWRLSRAQISDAAPLTALMLSSQAYTGEYRAILKDYTITPRQIKRDLIYLARGDEDLAGFYSLRVYPEAELDLMFVADKIQGFGLGYKLFEHMREQARALGIRVVKIVSHPPACEFYRRMGAKLVGNRKPSGSVSWERPILLIEP